MRDQNFLEDKFAADPKTPKKQFLGKLLSMQTVLLLPFYLDDPVHEVFEGFKFVLPRPCISN